MSIAWEYLLALGLLAGCVTGLLGMGGGLTLVPMMIGLGISPVQAVGTSSLAMLTITLSGSWYHWRRGSLDWRRILSLGLPALIVAQLGVYLAKFVPSAILLTAIALLLIANIYFARQRKHLELESERSPHSPDPRLAQPQLLTKRILIGSFAGFVAGLSGISGGVIVVPSQVLLLQTGFETAVQTSIGVMILSTGSAFVGHELRGNVLSLEGLILGSAGILGIQIGVRLLPPLRRAFREIFLRVLILLAAIYISWQLLTTRYRNH